MEKKASDQIRSSIHYNLLNQKSSLTIKLRKLINIRHSNLVILIHVYLHVILLFNVYTITFTAGNITVISTESEIGKLSSSSEILTLALMPWEKHHEFISSDLSYGLNRRLGGAFQLQSYRRRTEFNNCSEYNRRLLKNIPKKLW